MFKYIITLILIIPISARAIELASWLRFQRLLKEYDNPVYRASDRDVFLQTEYSANIIDEEPDDSRYHGHQKYVLNFYGSTGFKGQWISSKPYLQTDHQFSFEISGQIDKRSDIFINNTLGIYDSSKTLDQRATGTLTYGGLVRRYLFADRLNRFLFIEAGGRLNASAEYSRNHTQTHYQEEKEFLRSKIDRQTNCSAQSSLLPAIGFGKRLPVAPVYKAFEIERNLRKMKALNSKLADSSVMKLAALCGSLNSFRLSHDRPDKFIMSALDSIIRSDPSLDTAKYDAFSLFKVYETLNERHPLLFHGFEVKIRSDFNIDYYYLSQFPAENNHFPDAGSLGFEWSYLSPVQFAWTFPVLPRFFIEYDVNPPLFSTDKILLHYSSLKLYFFLTNRIQLDASINDISTFIILPNGYPGNILLSATFFLEDKLTLQCTAGKWFRPSQQQPNRSGRYMDQREKLTLQVGYDF